MKEVPTIMEVEPAIQRQSESAEPALFLLLQNSEIKGMSDSFQHSSDSSSPFLGTQKNDGLNQAEQDIDAVFSQIAEETVIKNESMLIADDPVPKTIPVPTQPVSGRHPHLFSFSKETTSILQGSVVAPTPI